MKISNYGIIEQDESGLWIATEDGGINRHSLISFLETYKECFEIVNTIHEDK